MKRLELKDAAGPLARYARQARRGAVLVLRRGRPIAAVVPMNEQDWEDYAVTHHRPLVAATRRSAARFARSGGLSLEEMTARLVGVTKPSRRKATRRPRRARRRTSRL